jgi:hypothetical protein
MTVVAARFYQGKAANRLCDCVDDPSENTKHDALGLLQATWSILAEYSNRQ